MRLAVDEAMNKVKHLSLLDFLKHWIENVESLAGWWIKVIMLCSFVVDQGSIVDFTKRDLRDLLAESLQSNCALSSFAHSLILHQWIIGKRTDAKW